MEKRGSLVLILAVVFLVAGAQCQLTFQETVFTDAENPGRCYDSVIDTYFDLHSVWWRPNQCMRLTCQLGNSPDSLTIVGERCQEFVAPANCSLQSNQYVLFPGCCPKLSCNQQITGPPESNELIEAIDEVILQESSFPASEEIISPVSSEEIVAPPSSEETVEDIAPISVETIEVPGVDSTSSEFGQLIAGEDTDDAMSPTKEDTPVTPLDEDSSVQPDPDTTGGEIGEQPDLASSGGEFGEQPDPATSGGEFGEQPDSVTTGEVFGEQPDTATTGEVFGEQPDPVSTVGVIGEQPDAIFTTQEPTDQAKPVLADYEQHSTGSYKFNPTMVTWEDAKLICESEGTNLAVVNSVEESEVLANMFAAYPEDYWNTQYGKIIFASVGFHDMDVEGQYVTIFGTPLNSTGYTRFWRKNEPNNLGASLTRPGEDCGSIHRNGGLNDFFCMLHLPFICEQ